MVLRKNNVVTWLYTKFTYQFPDMETLWQLPLGTLDAQRQTQLDSKSCLSSLEKNFKRKVFYPQINRFIVLKKSYIVEMEVQQILV